MERIIAFAALLMSAASPATAWKLSPAPASFTATGEIEAFAGFGHVECEASYSGKINGIGVGRMTIASSCPPEIALIGGPYRFKATGSNRVEIHGVDIVLTILSLHRSTECHFPKLKGTLAADGSFQLRETEASGCAVRATMLTPAPPISIVP